MTQHDRQRAARALNADWDKLDDIRDAVRALQSTDEPCLVPLHDRYMARLKELEAKKRDRFVLGFAFWTDHGVSRRSDVVLIKKKRPHDQAGKVNGIGGKVNDGETLIDAMCREFQQECGIPTEPIRWTYFAELVSETVEVACYLTDLKPTEHPQSPTDEQVEFFRVAKVHHLPLVDHAEWLIHLARESKALSPVKVKIR